MAALGRRPGQQQVLAARSNQPRQRQDAADRVALEGRQLRRRAPTRNYEATPLMVDGVLYTTAGTRRDVVAIDGATGETLWMYRLDEGQRGDVAPREGRPRRRVLVERRRTRSADHPTSRQGFHLVALDAKTGIPVPGFGKNGVVDLYEDFDQPIPQDGTIGSSSPPVVVRDVIVAGSALLAGTAPRSKENTKGYIRGYDVRTGKRLWTFHTIPQPGEVRQRHVAERFLVLHRQHRRLGVADRRRRAGLRLPSRRGATGDFYGGHRPGNNLFCGHARLPRRQDRQARLALPDRPSRHVGLRHCVAAHADQHHGERQANQGRRAGHQAESYLYVFDRVTGQAGLADRGEAGSQGRYAGRMVFADAADPDQAGAVRSPGRVGEADLIDFTPELHAEAMRDAQGVPIGPLFTPPSVATATCAARCRFRATRARRSGRVRRGIRKRTCSTCRRSRT